jgi:hypothetical protein
MIGSGVEVTGAAGHASVARSLNVPEERLTENGQRRGIADIGVEAGRSRDWKTLERRKVEDEIRILRNGGNHEYKDRRGHTQFSGMGSIEPWDQV